MSAVCDALICALRDTFLTAFCLARVAGNWVVVAGEGLCHGMCCQGLYCLYSLIYIDPLLLRETIGQLYFATFDSTRS